MRKTLFSNELPDSLISIALLLLRCAIGMLMLYGHGLPKFQKFDQLKESFPVPSLFSGWMNHATSLGLAIFTELFCCVFIIVGFATRLSAAFLACTMLIAAFVIHAKDPVFAAPAGGPSKEMALLYLVPAVFIMITGSGKFGLDAKLSQVKRRMFAR